MHASLVLVGPADCTEEEHAFARRLQTASEVPPDGMHTAATPLDRDAVSEPGGSTDVANISWVCPSAEQ